jgi:hypothetical protein
MELVQNRNKEYLNMNWGIYGILVIFGAFILLLIFNPNLSCFGRKVRSPFYPLLRKRKKKKIRTEDYGFHLVDEEKARENGRGGPLDKRER